MKAYHNALDVLPEHLVAEIQKHVGGCYLWIPTRERQSLEERNEYIIDLYEKGMPIEEIAETVFLSVRMVHYVVKKLQLRQKELQK